MNIPLGDEREPISYVEICYFRVLVLLGCRSSFSESGVQSDLPILAVADNALSARVSYGMIQINNGGSLIAEDYSGNIEDTIDICLVKKVYLSYNYYRLRPSAWFDNTRYLYSTKTRPGE